MDWCPILGEFLLYNVPGICCGSTVTLSRINCLLKMNTWMKMNNKNASVFEAPSREARWPIRPCWHDIHILPQYLNNFSLYRIENQKEIGGPSSDVNTVFLSVSLLESSNISALNEKCVCIFVCVFRKRAEWYEMLRKPMEPFSFASSFLPLWMMCPLFDSRGHITHSSQRATSSLGNHYGWRCLWPLSLSLTHRYFNF